MQGILGIGMAQLALAGNAQHRHAGLIAEVAGASDLSVSQTLIYQYEAQTPTSLHIQSLKHVQQRVT